MLHKSKLAAAVLSGFLLVGAVAPSLAEDKCEQRVHKAENRLQKEIAKHGEHSREAEQRRHDLDEARRQCRFDEHRDDHNWDHGHPWNHDHPDHDFH
jgi:hypothetical protein